MNEKELIRRCRNGDRAAFDTLIRKFYPYVTKYLLKLTASIIMLLFMLYWIIVALWVYQNARIGFGICMRSGAVFKPFAAAEAFAYGSDDIGGCNGNRSDSCGFH